MTLLTHRFQPVFGAATALAAVVLLQFGGLCAVSGQERAQPAAVPDRVVVEELKTALEVVKKQLDEERGKTAEAEAKARALTESLAESNRVADTIRMEYEELLLRMASFGVDLLKPDPKSLEQRLLKSVRNRQVAEDEKQKLAQQLLSLSESVVGFLQNAVSPDAESRERVERELRSTNTTLGLTTSSDRESIRALTEGQVVSIEPEIGLVVLNVGRKSGVRVGMPLRILRAETVIGSAMVVDVRDSIAGAVLQKIVNEKNDVKVGDRIQPQAEQL